MSGTGCFEGNDPAPETCITQALGKLPHISSNVNDSVYIVSFELNDQLYPPRLREI
jgi:hypothetical protein